MLQRDGRERRELDAAHAAAREPIAGTRAVELRSVVFQFPAAVSRTLRAGKIRFGANDVWHLSGGVIYESDHKTMRASRGQLQVSGRSAGHLFLEDAEPRTVIDLLAPLPADIISSSNTRQ